MAVLSQLIPPISPSRRMAALSPAGDGYRCPVHAGAGIGQQEGDHLGDLRRA